MQKSIYFLLAIFFSLAQAESVHDLDDETHLTDISQSGLTLSEENGHEVNMKITSNNGSTGYTWIIDHQGCAGVANINSGYVFYPPVEDDGFDVGYGEEVFTVTAEGKGECTFKVAYAKAWEFVSFEDYENQNGKVIAIPIRVADGDFENGDDDDCDPTDEDCLTKQKQELAFKRMGYQAWVRTFNGPINIIGFLPQAIAWTRASLGYEIAAHRFVWITKWWTNIGGWVSTLGTIYGVLVYLFDVDFFPGKGKKKLMAHTGGSKGKGSKYGTQIWYYVLGSMMLSIEVAGWTIYYFYYTDALDYGEALALELAELAAEEGESANDM